MTSQLLHSAIDSVRKFEWCSSIIAFVALFAAIWIPSVCSLLRWEWLDNRPSIVSAIMCGWLVGVVAVWFIGIRLAVRSRGLLCPHCGKPLTTKYRLVIASGSCSYCGKSVVDAVV